MEPLLVLLVDQLQRDAFGRRQRSLCVFSVAILTRGEQKLELLLCGQILRKDGVCSSWGFSLGPFIAVPLSHSSFRDAPTVSFESRWQTALSWSITLPITAIICSMLEHMRRMFASYKCEVVVLNLFVPRCKLKHQVFFKPCLLKSTFFSFSSLKKDKKKNLLGAHPQVKNCWFNVIF